METRIIYAVTEKDVDGCGGDATEYVEAAAPLAQGQQEILAGILRVAKAKAAGKDWSTYDIVEAAIGMFNQDQAGPALSMAASPIADEISF